MRIYKTQKVAAGILFTGFIMVFFLLPSLILAQEDIENSADHPLFSRMKDFYIDNYQKNFDLVNITYIVENGDEEEEKEIEVEGNVTEISYYLKDDKQEPSPYQIIKNHLLAAEKLGAEIIAKSREKAFMKVSIDGRQAWVVVDVYNGGGSYTLKVIQMEEMEQEVTAGNLMDELNQKGRVTVYIHFDTNSAELDEKADPVIEEISTMLLENPDLNLIVEGHTDSIGNPEDNLELSRERAEAVVNALIDKDVDSQRLTSQGYGDTRPIADNDTPDGRAKNRRVELVKP